MILARKWLRTAILAAATAAGAPPLFAPRPALAAEVAPVPTKQDLDQLRKSLVDANVAPLDRDRAAQRLISYGHATADYVLRQVLESPRNTEGKLAVTKALPLAPQANLVFVGPLRDLLDNADLAKTAALALASYRTSEVARGILVAFAENTTKPLKSRLVVVSALGKLVDRRTAEVLIRLLNKDSNALIRSAAADALVEMTGLSQYGQDAQQWNRWWRAYEIRANSKEDPKAYEAELAAKDDSWTRELLNKNATRAFDLDRRLQQLREQTLRLARDDVQRTPDANRAKKLITYLQSDSEDLRVVAAQIIYEDAVAVDPKPIPAPVFDVLRGMVDDASPDVRARIARTIGILNDPGSLDVLLAQLPKEKDLTVRREIIDALRPIQSLRTLPPLLNHLDDPSFAVARRAAEALKDKADLLHRKDANPANQSLTDAAARQTARLLLERFNKARKEDNAAPLRLALVEAMAAIGPGPIAKPMSELERDYLAIFYQLIRAESTAVRCAALRGLKQIGNADSVSNIVPLLNDDESVVRLNALDALSTTASDEQISPVKERLAVERDPSISSRAWEIVLLLIEKAPANVVADWAKPAKWTAGESDYPRRLAILLILEKKLEKAQRPAELAQCQQDVGELLVRVQKPAEAIPRLTSALGYLVQAKADPSRTTIPVELLVEAMLAAKKYPDLNKFATDLIRQDPRNGGIIGPKIKEHLETLKRAGDFDEALAVLEEANKIPLGETYLKFVFPKMQQDIRDLKKQAAGTGGRTMIRQAKTDDYAAADPATAT